MRGFIAKRVSRSIVQTVFNHTDLSGRDGVEVGTFREVSADEAVCFRFEPVVADRRNRLDTQGVGDGVLSEFTAIIPSVGVQRA